MSDNYTISFYCQSCNIYQNVLIDDANESMKNILDFLNQNSWSVEFDESPFKIKKILCPKCVNPKEDDNHKDNDCCDDQDSCDCR